LFNESTRFVERIRVSKPLEGYTQNTQDAAALNRAHNHDLTVDPGQASTSSSTENSLLLCVVMFESHVGVIQSIVGETERRIREGVMADRDVELPETTTPDAVRSTLTEHAEASAPWPGIRPTATPI
jgi:hypothetical protein